MIYTNKEGVLIQVLSDILLSLLMTCPYILIIDVSNVMRGICNRLNIISEAQGVSKQYMVSLRSMER